MADRLKFGPEWLRQLSTGGSLTSPPPSPSFGGKYRLAEFRYGREEMLALFSPTLQPPDDLDTFPALLKKECQIPLAFISPTSEEEGLLSSSVNSTSSRRPGEKGGPMMRGSGRGPGGPRGRGRGRVEPALSRSGSEDWSRSRRPGGEGVGRGSDGPAADRWKDLEVSDGSEWRKPAQKNGGSWRDSWSAQVDSNRRFGRQASYESARFYQPSGEEELPEWALDDPAVEENGTFDASGAFMSLSDLAAATNPETDEREDDCLTNSSHSDQQKSANAVTAANLTTADTKTSEQPVRLREEQSNQLDSSITRSTNENYQPESLLSQLTTREHEEVPPRESGATIPETSHSRRQEAVLELRHVASAEAILSEDDLTMFSKNDSLIDDHIFAELSGSHTPPGVGTPTTSPSWFYCDPQGATQGPFTADEMYDWFSAGYFTMELLIRSSNEREFQRLGDRLTNWDRRGITPFTLIRIEPRQLVESDLQPVFPLDVITEQHINSQRKKIEERILNEVRTLRSSPDFNHFSDADLQMLITHSQPDIQEALVAFNMMKKELMMRQQSAVGDHILSPAHQGLLTSPTLYQPGSPITSGRNITGGTSSPHTFAPPPSPSWNPHNPNSEQTLIEQHLQSQRQQARQKEMERAHARQLDAQRNQLLEYKHQEALRRQAQEDQQLQIRNRLELQRQELLLEAQQQEAHRHVTERIQASSSQGFISSRAGQSGNHGSQTTSSINNCSPQYSAATNISSSKSRLSNVASNPTPITPQSSTTAAQSSGWARGGAWSRTPYPHATESNHTTPNMAIHVSTNSQSGLMPGADSNEPNYEPSYSSRISNPHAGGEIQSEADQFTDWCIQSLTRLAPTVDAAAFFTFLKGVDSSEEIRSFMFSYLEESPSAISFVQEYLRRRSTLLGTTLSTVVRPGYPYNREMTIGGQRQGTKPTRPDLNGERLGDMGNFT